MFTEAELRDALHHSAARADTLPIPTPSATPAPAAFQLVVEPAEVPAHPAAGPAPARRRGRVLVPVAAAAVLVAAVTVASVLVTGQDRTGGTAAGPPASPPSPGSSEQASPAAPTSNPAVDLVDLFRIGATGVVNNEFRTASEVEHGAQTAYRWVGPTRTAVLTVVPAGNIDAGRIPRDRPVPIGSTTGYYSLFKLFPLDANTGPFSDKWLPYWTIAFQTPAGDWAFASIEAHTQDPGAGHGAGVDDPAQIAAEFAASAVTFTPGGNRLAFRLGHLPAGLRANNVSFDTGVPGPGAVSVYFTDGSASLHVQLMHPDSVGQSCSLQPVNQPPSDGRGCVPPLERTIGGHVVQVTSSGVDPAEAQRVLDGVELAPDLDDRSTYFPIADALS